MPDQQRSLLIACLGGLLVLFALLLYQNGNAHKGAASAADAGADLTAAHLDAGPSFVADPALAPGDAGDLVQMLGGGDDQPPADPRNTNTGLRLPDGTEAPSLSDKAPRSVRCGVILVTYAGAQGAPATARPRAEATSLASAVATQAKTDFKGAVAKGDSGSADDIGRVPRGVLEPAVEFALFSLPVGGVSDPVDTPRGFWIVKRIE